MSASEARTGKIECQAGSCLTERLRTSFRWLRCGCRHENSRKAEIECGREEHVVCDQMQGTLAPFLKIVDARDGTACRTNLANIAQPLGASATVLARSFKRTNMLALNYEVEVQRSTDDFSLKRRSTEPKKI
jgi:hypothetical protein